MKEEDYQAFAIALFGQKFNDINLLTRAFTHRSWLNENRKKRGLKHNERLEFLGDAVLELITTEYLFEKYTEPEGILTNWRSALVRTESIGAAAQKLGYEQYLRLSRGEKRGSSRARLQILANAYEAVLGAIYLDLGYEVSKKFVSENLLVTLDEILKSGSWQDPKSQLQELAQAKESLTPSYKVLEEDGPDHDKVFTIGVFVGSQLRGTGKGPSKQHAQQDAAEKALEFYND